MYEVAIHNRLFPLVSCNKIVRDRYEAELVAEVRQALNVWLYSEFGVIEVEAEPDPFPCFPKKEVVLVMP